MATKENELLLVVVLGVLDVKSWIGQPEDWQPKARVSLHAVAVNTNLQPNEGK